MYRDRSAAGIQTDEDEPEDETGAIGVWLNQSRLKSQMSVPELAKKADVTPATIHAIEAGRISNPRDSTRAKIERALGERLSPELAKEIESESAIEGIGELVDFNPHEPDDIPDEPGVYVLYDISERPVYVGQGQNIKARLKDHEQRFWFKRPIVETAAYVRLGDSSVRVRTEALLIRFLKRNAVLNKQNVER